MRGDAENVRSELVPVGYAQGDLRLCTGHEHWVGAADKDPKFYEFCAVHDVSSDDLDADLRAAVPPLAYLPKKMWRGVALIGGRNELLELRADLDDILAVLP